MTYKVFTAVLVAIYPTFLHLGFALKSLKTCGIPKSFSTQ